LRWYDSLFNLSHAEKLEPTFADGDHAHQSNNTASAASRASGA